MARDRIVLRAKLAVPAGPASRVSRERLFERLEPPRPVTLICAPAGFGKTVVAADWVQRLGVPFGWVSLDEGDDDAARFLLHLAAAVQAVEPGAGRAITDAASSLRDSDVPALVEPFVNRLHDIEGPFVVVLDDYHLIGEPRVHDVVGFLIEHMPPSMQVVLTARQEPPLPLPRWRVRSQLAELGQDDLRFTEEEAARFLTETMGLSLSTEQIELLERRTEGWAGGLQLAALSLHRRKDADAFLETFAGDDRYIMDYLTEEVLAAQSPEVRRFLLRTSVLERMHADLCAAVTGLEDCGALLERLERDRVFVVALDDERGWYRYHHLFRGLLQHQLAASSEDRASECHLAASEYFEAEGSIADAVRHALLASDHERVAALVARHGWSLIFGGGAKQIVAWLREIPARVLLDDPQRLSIALWSDYIRRGRVRSEWRERVEELLRTEPHASKAEAPHIRDEVALIDAFEAARDPRRHREAIDLASRLEEAPGGARPFVVLAARSIRTSCAHALGDVRTAETAYPVAVRTALEHRHATMYFVNALGEGRLRALRGGPAEGRRSLEAARAAAAEQGWGALPFVSWLSCGLGEVAYEQGDFETCERAFEEAVSLAEHEPPVVRHVALVGLARLRWAQGRADEIEPILAPLDEEPYVRPLTPVLPELEVQRASLALVRGRLDEAGSFIEARSLEGDTDRSLASDAEILVLARHLLERHRHERAIAVVLERLGEAERSGRVDTVVRLRLHLAVARLTSGEWRQAVEQLDAVLDEALPRGYRRLFVDAPAALSALLERRVQVGIEDPERRATVERLLAERGAPPSAAGRERPAEPLSPSELRVLELLVAGLSNKEIGERLFISLNTVKTHLRRVYAKLGAKGRAEAIREAHALGLPRSG